MTKPLKHPPRVTGVIEVGPHDGSPYANWGVYEVAPDAFDEAIDMDDDLLDLDVTLDAVDTGDSPSGPFKAQVRQLLQDGRRRLQLGEPSPVRKSLVVPYDQDLRDRRGGDDDAVYNVETAQPRDLEIWVIVHLVEDDQ